MATPRTPTRKASVSNLGAAGAAAAVGMSGPMGGSAGACDGGDHGHSHSHGHGHSHGPGHSHDSHAQRFGSSSLNDIHSARTFKASRQRFYTPVLNALRLVSRDRKAKLFLYMGMAETVFCVAIFVYATAIHSMAMSALNFRILWDVFGYDRSVVLAYFTSSMLMLLAASMVVKECLEHSFEPPNVESATMPMVCVVVAAVHFAAQFMLVTRSSSYRALGALTKMPAMARRGSALGSHLLAGGTSSAVVAVAAIIMRFWPTWTELDLLAAGYVGAVLGYEVYPIFKHCALVLLQTAPQASSSQLEKALREVSTYNGVLEFNNAHFWTIANDKVAGSLHVRVRRDADEQAVLTKIQQNLGQLVAPGSLTVQIVKDDWVLPGTPGSL